jgi:hypothetical protein
MSCRGVYFALATEEESRLLSARGDEELMEVLEEIEQAWDENRLQETDKAWDAIHRCLSDGTLNPQGGEYPLKLCVLGGKHLHQGDNYIVTFVARSAVPDVSRAMAKIGESWMREHYFRIDPKDYGFPLTDEDFQYTWGWFEAVREFYREAAEKEQSVIFTVGQ